MTFGYGIETPEGKIGAAGTSLSLALRLCAAASDGRLSPEIYAKGVIVASSAQTVRVPPEPEKTKDDLELETSNLVILALGASAVIVDEALDAKFGQKDPLQTTGLWAMRAMVYQLRNAFAHNPLRPKWSIKGKYHRQYQVEVEGTKFLFDATALDGKPVDPGHIGDFHFWSHILDYSGRIVV